jgi:hypothetical protein
MVDEQRETHPSYAQISASRVTSSGGVPCYGSKLRHSQFINITIAESECVRSINSDRYHDHKQLITVRLTLNQFAEFITSLNIGGGVPCTIERLNMKMIPEPPYRNEAEIVKADFEEKAKEVADTLTDAQKLLAEMRAPGGKAGKGVLAELAEKLEKAVREIGNNMPYMAECFHETMEDVVTTAKIDIEAYASDAAARAGVPGLAAPVTLQIEGTNTYGKPWSQQAAEEDQDEELNK